MPNAPSSISSSEPRQRPLWGLLLACLLLGGVEATAQALGRARIPRPLTIDDFGPTRQPGILLIGDSRMGRVDFGAFASAYRPEGSAPSGMTWFMDDGSVTAQMESLARRGLAPRLLVVALSPSSALQADHLQRGRDRLRAAENLEAWEAHLRSKLVHNLFTCGRQNGLAGLIEGFFAWRRLASGVTDADFRRTEKEAQIVWEKSRREIHLQSYRNAFADQPAPSRQVMEALVRAMGTLQQKGSRVVLVRLPISRDGLALEDAWGAPEAFRKIAASTGAPYLDFHALPLYSELEPAVLDASHVNGDGPRALLAAELGARVRALAPP